MYINYLPVLYYLISNTFSENIISTRWDLRKPLLTVAQKGFDTLVHVHCLPEIEYLQRAALGQSQGFVKNYPESSIGCRGMLQLLCSQARKKLQEELLKKINRTSMTDLVPLAVETQDNVTIQLQWQLII